MKRIFAATAAVLSIACAEVTTEPPEEDFEVARIEVTAGSDFIEVGETTQLIATAFNAVGDDITMSTEFIWSSEPSTIVDVNQDGLATGVSEGQANVTATVNASEVEGTIEIQVVPATGPAN